MEAICLLVGCLTSQHPEESRPNRDWNPGSSAPEADALTTRPTRRSHFKEGCGTGSKGKFESGQNKSKAGFFFLFVWGFFFSTRRWRLQHLVRYHGHKLQTLFQNVQCFVGTYQQQLSRLPSTVSTLKSDTAMLLLVACLTLLLLFVVVQRRSNMLLYLGNRSARRITMCSYLCK